MKHNRLLALFIAVLLMLAPMAQATGHIAYFHQPDGVERYALEEMSNAAVPQGLEEMYTLFAMGNPEATVYVFRMPDGQALLSISCLETGAEGSTEALAEQKERIAEGLAAQLEGVLAAVPELTLEEIYGQQALVTQMSLHAGEMVLDAKAAVFYRGADLIEVWTVAPNQSQYLFDEAAADQLKSDLACLAEMEASLDFALPEEKASTIVDALQDGSGEQEERPRMTVTADDGTFRMDVPLDTVVLHSASDENTVARTRALFADVEGGQACFDLWLEEIREVEGWLLISRETGVAAQVYVNPAESFAGMTAEQLCMLEQPVLEMMKQDYDSAAVADESSVAELDGLEHAWLSYSLDKGDMHLLTFVLAAADQDYLYEIDIYVGLDESSDDDTLTEIVLMMLESLDYLPEVGV